MSRHMDTSTTTQMANIEDSVVLLERNLYGHPLAGPLWERQFEEVLLVDVDGKNYRNLFVHRKQGLFLSVDVDDIEMAGRKQHLSPMWQKLMRLVGLGEPTSFLDNVYHVPGGRRCTARDATLVACLLPGRRTLHRQNCRGCRPAGGPGSDCDGARASSSP